MNDLSMLAVTGVDGPGAERRRGHGDPSTFAALLAGLLEAAGNGAGESADSNGDAGALTSQAGRPPGWSPTAPAWAGTVETAVLAGAALDEAGTLDPDADPREVAEAVAALLGESADLIEVARLTEAIVDAADRGRDVDPLLARVATEVAGQLAADAAGDADSMSGEPPPAVVADALARSTERALADLERARGTEPARGAGAAEAADGATEEGGEPVAEKLTIEKLTADEPADEPAEGGSARATAARSADEDGAPDVDESLDEGVPPTPTLTGAGNAEAATAGQPSGEGDDASVATPGRPAQPTSPSQRPEPADEVAEAPDEQATSTEPDADGADGSGDEPLARGDAQATMPTVAVSGVERAAAAAPAAMTGPLGAAGGGAVARVVAALEQLRSAGPPRSVSLELPELEGLRLRVTLRGASTVDVRVTGRLPDAEGWLRDLGAAVSSRGLELGDVDADGEGAPGRRRQPADPPPEAVDEAAASEPDAARAGPSARPGLRL